MEHCIFTYDCYCLDVREIGLVTLVAVRYNPDKIQAMIWMLARPCGVNANFANWLYYEWLLQGADHIYGLSLW